MSVAVCCFGLAVALPSAYVLCQVFAPIMGFSACFGGPMLNILIGVGISGSYVITHSGEPYHLPLSPTLITNGFGLLAILFITVIVVPLNGFYLKRVWGIFLVCCYVALVATTIFVELKTESAH